MSRNVGDAEPRRKLQHCACQSHQNSRIVNNHISGQVPQYTTSHIAVVTLLSSTHRYSFVPTSHFVTTQTPYLYPPPRLPPLYARAGQSWTWLSETTQQHLMSLTTSQTCRRYQKLGMGTCPWTWMGSTSSQMHTWIRTLRLSRLQCLQFRRHQWLLVVRSLMLE